MHRVLSFATRQSAPTTSLCEIKESDGRKDPRTAPHQDDKEKLEMTTARRDGLYLLLLGSLVFLLLGTVLARTAPAAMLDFKVLYYPARCLLQNGDPYNENEVQRTSHAPGGAPPWDTLKVRQVVTQDLYPPTAFSFTVPFAMLPWGPAHILWTALTIGSLVFASFLVWNLGADYAPIISEALVGFLLANSELLVIAGNAAGIAISLCVADCWCFVRERFVLPGILCFAISSRSNRTIREWSGSISDWLAGCTGNSLCKRFSQQLR